MTGCLTSLRRLQSRHIIRSPEVPDLVFAIGRETCTCSVVSSTRGGGIKAEQRFLTFGPCCRDLPQAVSGGRRSLLPSEKEHPMDPTNQHSQAPEQCHALMRTRSSCPRMSSCRSYVPAAL